MDTPSPEQDTGSCNHLADDFAPRLASSFPLTILAWTPSNFRKAQMSIAEELEQEKHRLRETCEEQETSDLEERISAIDAELRAWSETRRASADLEPSCEDFLGKQQAYEARIQSLEAEIEGLKAGGGPKEPPHPVNAIRTKELEKKWLEQATCPSTTEEWKQKLTAILSDVVTREAELETERRGVSEHRANVDHEKAKLHACKARVDGDMASAAATANELLTMIRNVRYNLQKQKDHRDRSAKKAADSSMSPLDAMLAAEQVFKPTYELTQRIVVKLNTARESMAGFWDGEKGGDGARSPWELIRAIKARDDKIAELEGEVREFRESVARFTGQIEKAQEAAGKSTAEGQAAEVTKVFADQVAALTQLASGAIPANNDVGNDPSDHGLPVDEAELISSEEYGNVLKMAEKFDRVKSNLQVRIAHFQQLAASYKAERDQALKSADESGETCQLLRDEIESIRADCLPRIEEAVRTCEARHAHELKRYRTEIHEVKKELIWCEDELRKKTVECEELADKLVGEKKRLLAYNMDRFSDQDAMNPIVQNLLEQTDKEQEALKNRIQELNDTIGTLEAQNTTLEKKLQSERKRLSRYLDTINSVPALKRGLDEAERAAGKYRHDLKDAEGYIDILQHELRQERNRAFDFENREAEAKHVLAALRSELADQKEECEKTVTGMRKKLEIEIARHSAKAAESRKEYRELLEQYGKPTSEITEGTASAIVPTLLLKSALSQRASLLEQLRALREEYASLLSDKKHAVREAEESREELAEVKEVEKTIREEHATALIQLQNAQAKLDHAIAEVKGLKSEVGKQEERQTDPGKVWDDTPIGMSKEVLESRIEVLEENLAKALRTGGSSGTLTEHTDGPRIKNSRELFSAMRQTDGTWSSSDGPPKLTLTAADMANFWHQGSLLNKKLALLRAIRDGDLACGYEAMDGLDRFLRETDLGPASDEAWGSVQYLEAYFHLYTAGDVVAAQAAARRAVKHRPEGWSRQFYRDMGARLEADLDSERTASETSESE